jgi:hypothetical protein
VTQIRSYRRVFDLERRIYSVDRMRLNPSGVPLRGVVYLLAAIACAIFAARLPVVGVALRPFPWFARDVLAPAALAAALTVVRVDGRAFHQAALSMAAFVVSPRRTVGLARQSHVRRRWRPSDLLFLPDGSDPEPRSFRYTGPGAVVVLVSHESRPGSRRGLRPGRVRSRGHLTAARDARRLKRARVVGVDAGASLLVGTHRRARRT